MAAIWHGAMGRIRNLSGPLSSTSLEYSYCLILSAQNGTYLVLVDFGVAIW